MTRRANEPTPTIPMTDESLELLRDNSVFGRTVDFPAGLRAQALALSVNVETTGYRSSEDETEQQARIIDRARAFEAYLRDGADQ